YFCKYFPAVDTSSFHGSGSFPVRKREFIPDSMKDISYWDKRRKNNEAAKRSREKRRLNDLVLEGRVVGLLEENSCLRAELSALKFRFGLTQASTEPPAARTTSLTFAVTRRPRNNEPNSPTASSDSAYGSSASEGSPVGMVPPPSPPSSIANGAMATPVSVLRQPSERGRCCSPYEGKKMSLPHKLRFKMAATCDPPASRPCDAEMAITGPVWPQMEIGGSQPLKLQCGRNQELNHSVVTITENERLRSELNTLSAEVAQLKWLFTEGHRGIFF
uniref:Nuclear factor, interleukin 3 regulated, member 6 n=1 Tax=Eptatretus burgeri TaxID=7764 RepID=A0A8C4QEG8_EPTBU